MSESLYSTRVMFCTKYAEAAIAVAYRSQGNCFQGKFMSTFRK